MNLAIAVLVAAVGLTLQGCGRKPQPVGYQPYPSQPNPYSPAPYPSQPQPYNPAPYHAGRVAVDGRPCEHSWAA
eukprot:CAMPEP_0168356436 /NCGR_PEP_ID=MMETSP0228-20121227/31_1 /TAXON_ID=133427 /ORGANISM="Protoceratium reticulatum, Strain CCCM 535 (=CCMP 1889)" /LENGTH=73 /DNA_ID=CAMNT_0008368845 /DNA_START=89 /DNA_END=307 /DNA_ORIENTATION=+